MRPTTLPPAYLVNDDEDEVTLTRIYELHSTVPAPGAPEGEVDLLLRWLTAAASAASSRLRSSSSAGSP